jgi:hypothetical protein
MKIKMVRPSVGGEDELYLEEILSRISSMIALKNELTTVFAQSKPILTNLATL